MRRVCGIRPTRWARRTWRDGRRSHVVGVGADPVGRAAGVERLHRHAPEGAVGSVRAGPSAPAAPGGPRSSKMAGTSIVHPPWNYAMPLVSNRLKVIKPSPTLAGSAKAAKLEAQGEDVDAMGAGEPGFDSPAVHQGRG